jgi:hypothetical protein
MCVYMAAALVCFQGVQVAHMIREYSTCLREYSTRAVAVKGMV